MTYFFLTAQLINHFSQIEEIYFLENSYFFGRLYINLIYSLKKNLLHNIRNSRFVFWRSTSQCFGKAY
jgi:hypothetical protein